MLLGLLISKPRLSSHLMKVNANSWSSLHFFPFLTRAAKRFLLAKTSLFFFFLAKQDIHCHVYLYFKSRINTDNILLDKYKLCIEIRACLVFNTPFCRPMRFHWAKLQVYLFLVHSLADLFIH